MSLSSRNHTSSRICSSGGIGQPGEMSKPGAVRKATKLTAALLAWPASHRCLRCFAKHLGTEELLWILGGTKKMSGVQTHCG